MNTVLVWFLVSLGGKGGDQVVYSPPMPDLATCEFLRKSMPSVPDSRIRELNARCIQIRMVVIK